MDRRTGLVAILALALFIPGLHVGDAAPKPPSFVYVHDDGTPNQVFGFSISSKGVLAALPGSPFAAGPFGEGSFGAVNSAAYSRQRRLLFVGGTDGIVVFQVAANGALTQVAGSPFASEEIQSVAVVESGPNTFVYALDPFEPSVLGFAVQPDGSLVATPGTRYAAGNFPLCLSAAGNLVVAANEGDGTLSVYRAQGDGSLVASPGTPFTVPGAFITNVAVTPSGKFVYVPDFTTGAHRVFGFAAQSATGALTPLSGSPFETAVHDSPGVLASPKPLIVAMGIPGGGGGPDLQVLRAKAAGTLKAGFSRSSGLMDLQNGAFSRNGKFMVVASGESQAIRSFQVAGSGKLTLVSTGSLPGSSELNGVVFAEP